MGSSNGFERFGKRYSKFFGRDDALMRWAELEQRRARPLHLVGYEEEAE